MTLMILTSTTPSITTPSITTPSITTPSMTPFMRPSTTESMMTVLDALLWNSFLHSFYLKNLSMDELQVHMYIFISFIMANMETKYKQILIKEFLSSCNANGELSFRRKDEFLEKLRKKLNHTFNLSYSINKKRKEIQRDCHQKKVSTRSPLIWGPDYWKFIHFISYSFSQENRVLMRYLLSNLPCSICKKHALRYVKKQPFDKINQSKCPLYFIRFHDAVNRTHTNSKKQVCLKTTEKAFHQEIFRLRDTGRQLTYVQKKEKNSRKKKREKKPEKN